MTTNVKPYGIFNSFESYFLIKEKSADGRDEGIIITCSVTHLHYSLSSPLPLSINNGITTLMVYNITGFFQNPIKKQLCGPTSHFPRNLRTFINMGTRFLKGCVIIGIEQIEGSAEEFLMDILAKNRSIFLLKLFIELYGNRKHTTFPVSFAKILIGSS